MKAIIKKYMQLTCGEKCSYLILSLYSAVIFTFGYKYLIASIPWNIIFNEEKNYFPSIKHNRSANSPPNVGRNLWG